MMSWFWNPETPSKRIWKAFSPTVCSNLFENDTQSERQLSAGTSSDDELGSAVCLLAGICSVHLWRGHRGQDHCSPSLLCQDPETRSCLCLYRVIAKFTGTRLETGENSGTGKREVLYYRWVKEQIQLRFMELPPLVMVPAGIASTTCSPRCASATLFFLSPTWLSPVCLDYKCSGTG